jgi:hypothetical protein
MGYSFTPLIRLIVLQGHATGRVGGLGLSQLLCQLIDLLTTLSRLAAPGMGSLRRLFTQCILIPPTASSAHSHARTLPLHPGIA